MKNSSVWLASLIASLVSVSALVAQTSPTKIVESPPPTLSAAEQKWVNLQLLLSPPPASRQIFSADPQRQALERQQQAQRFLRAADEAQLFARDEAGHPKAVEALRLAAKALFQAAMAGDNSREAEAATLLDSVRRDTSLSAKSRLELVSLANIVRLRPLVRDRVRFLTENEKSAHGLIAEFPGEPSAYEGLVRLAESHPDDGEAIRIARDVLAMPAPEKVKAAAQLLLDRQALVGKSLPFLAGAALGQTNPISATKEQGIILYTWAQWSPGSIATGKNLIKNAPNNVRVVGVNLDEDAVKARALATSEGLVGDQIYDNRGLESPLAQALKFGRAGEVYVASSEGTLRSVSAQRGDLTAKLGAASR